jgi:hypothetical protein
MTKHKAVLWRICMKTKEREGGEKKKKDIHVYQTCMHVALLESGHWHASNTTKEGDNW